MIRNPILKPSIECHVGPDSVSDNSGETSESKWDSQTVEEYLKSPSTPTTAWLSGKMILVGLALVFAAHRVLGKSSVEPEQIHISYGVSPSEFVITWNTNSTTPNTYVKYGVGVLSRKESGESRKFVDGGKQKRIQFVHRVHLKNLQPDRFYVYKCGSDMALSDEFWFRTPLNGSDWSPKVMFYGDMGTKGAFALPHLKNEAKTHTYDAFVHVGDLAYDMKDNEGRRGDQFMNLIQPIAAHVPYMVCPGNHEKHYNFSHFRERFTMPGEFESLFYSFDLGPAHFISFNTEAYYYYEKYGETQLSVQYDWLENDLKVANLKENREARPWIITYGHRPMYCSNVDHNCSANASPIRIGIDKKGFGLERLFNSYGVDVSIWGHDHSYERTFPVFDSQVRNGSYHQPYENPRATVHIVTGAAGNKEDLADFLPEAPGWSAKRLKEYGYTVMNIANSTHLHIEQYATPKQARMRRLVDSIWLVKQKRRF